jgi:glycosyltransferase involved in cell wall biosynthesis
MRILHTETLKRWGGQQNRILMECTGMRKLGHEMIIACNKGSMLAQKARKVGIKVYEVRMLKQTHLITIPKIIKIIKDEAIDIVCTHSSVDSWAGGIAAKIAKRKLIRFRHNIYPIGRDFLTRLIYTMPDKFVAISNTIKDILVNSGIREEKINVIHSCVDTEKFNPDMKDIRQQLGIPHDAIIIGNTATFAGVKGQEFLFKAFNKIGKESFSFLLFAGRISEDSKGKYLSYVDKDLRDNIIFLGHREDIPEVLKTIDIFVYPSVSEGLGTALLEAMAMEKPVVVSDIPTFKDFIRDNENGLFFRNKDSDDIAEKVLFLIRNFNLRKKIAKKGSELINKNFSYEKMIFQTETLYKSIMLKK